GSSSSNGAVSGAGADAAAGNTGCDAATLSGLYAGILSVLYFLSATGAGAGVGRAAGAAVGGAGAATVRGRAFFSRPDSVSFSILSKSAFCVFGRLSIGFTAAGCGGAAGAAGFGAAGAAGAASFFFGRGRTPGRGSARLLSRS